MASIVCSIVCCGAVEAVESEIRLIPRYSLRARLGSYVFLLYVADYLSSWSYLNRDCFVFEHAFARESLEWDAGLLS